MKTAIALAAAALVAVPSASRADIGVRAGLEALVASHDGNAGKTAVFLGDQSIVTGDLMLQYWLPADIISIDAEIAEAYDFKAGHRVGTTFRPGITISPPVLPIYVRGAVPIDFEGPNNRPTIAGLRLGVGTNIGLPIAKIYLEADADFPLFGGTGAPSAFSVQNLSLGAGVAFRF